MQLTRQFDAFHQLIRTALNDNLIVMRPLCKVLIEHRITDQVNNVLHEVTLGIKAQMLRGRLIAPLNSAFRIKQYDPLGEA